MANHRKTMQDSLNGQRTFLSGINNSGDEFPQIKSICFKYREYGDLPQYCYNRQGDCDRNGYEDIIDNKYLIGEYLDCKNERCNNGGYRIRFIIREMVRRKIEHQDGTIYCIGNEGSPGGRIKGHICSNYINYKIDISYS
ncbi:hypothetical protein [Desulfovibrio intestinalis]|uniref:Uncharacterized protein n=1 Tax=Desulfovibrio intestinalis TaxID=58621 RepID=A0A7W8C259_9BACT|nr:hypothetical protein [Desulfovibrio intestinalis]MBB5143926.1 hypothetical protein [Desulfovibrio intestinalis]